MPNESATKWSASFLASLTPRRRKGFLASLTPQELNSLSYDWRFWARPGQRAPEVAAQPLDVDRGRDRPVRDRLPVRGDVLDRM